MFIPDSRVYWTFLDSWFSSLLIEKRTIQGRKLYEEIWQKTKNSTLYVVPSQQSLINHIWDGDEEYKSILDPQGR